MSAERDLTSREAVAFLASQVKRREIAVLLGLMLVASLSEGLGLVLLIPLTQLFVGPEAAAASGLLAPLADAPVAALLAGFVGLVSLRAVIVFLVNERRRDIGLALGKRLRTQAHAALMGADWRWLSRQHSGDHAALVMAEADRAAGLADHVLVTLTGLVTVAILLVSTALVSWQVALALLVFGGAASLLYANFSRGGQAEGRAYVAAHGKLQRLVTNALSHLRAARIAGAQAGMARDFDTAVRDLAAVEQRYFRATHAANMLFQIGAAFALAMFVYVAVELAAIPLAFAIPLTALAVRLVPLLGSLQQARRSWQFDIAGLGYLLSSLEAARAHPDVAEAEVPPVHLSRELALRGVTLTYEGRSDAVFEHFDMVIPAGAIIAVRGQSGAGKSSLADLVSGLIRPDEGDLCIDGVALGDAQRVSWRRHVAYVEQEPYLTPGTIAQNIAWGASDDLGPQAIRDAITAASAEFVFDLPQGIETEMGEDGRLFSGGEKQRIALARALLAKPQLLVLDEVTAGLDARNAEQIGASVCALRGRCAVLILSHDERMLALGDEVIDLDEARACRAPESRP